MRGVKNQQEKFGTTVSRRNCFRKSELQIQKNKKVVVLETTP